MTVGIKDIALVTFITCSFWLLCFKIVMDAAKAMDEERERVAQVRKRLETYAKELGDAVNDERDTQARIAELIGNAEKYFKDVEAQFEEIAHLIPLVKKDLEEKHHD